MTDKKLLGDEIFQQIKTIGKRNFESALSVCRRLSEDEHVPDGDLIDALFTLSSHLDLANPLLPIHREIIRPSAIELANENVSLRSRLSALVEAAEKAATLLGDLWCTKSISNPQLYGEVRIASQNLGRLVEQAKGANQMNRPDYIRCIQHTRADKRGTSWCGQRVAQEFTFASIDHAVYNKLRNGRLIACPECVTAVVESLTQAKEEYK